MYLNISYTYTYILIILTSETFVHYHIYITDIDNALVNTDRVLLWLYLIDFTYITTFYFDHQKIMIIGNSSLYN